MASSYVCHRCLHSLRTTPLLRSQLSQFRRPVSKRIHRSLCAPFAQQTLFQHTQASQSSARSPEIPTGVVLRQDDLFHPFSSSPIPAIRKRAAFMKQNAYCSHPSHARTRILNNDADLEGRKPTTGGLPPARVRFECPYCGIPVSCSEEHWADDFETHVQVCDVMRQENEDTHDLHSGRVFPEFEYGYQQMEEAQVNLTNWDTLLYSRDFAAINSERQLRHATRILTYPITIGSILHELSPYNIRAGGRLTVEGLKSLGALRYMLHPPDRPPLEEGRSAAEQVREIRLQPPPQRIFVLGARAESSLPRDAWIQLALLFKRIQFHVILIGPEAMTNRDAEYPLPTRDSLNPFGAVRETIAWPMKMSTYVEYFQTLHEANHFHPYDPYFDCFVLFHPGLGHPASAHEWAPTIPALLETKCPIICTGYHEADMMRDVEWVRAQAGGEMDILLEPGENRFRSLRWDVNDYDTAEVTAGNWGVWAFRGKRYEATAKDEVKV